MADAPLMAGKKGLVMGIANDRSLAYGIAQTVADHGAELALTYQGDALAKRVLPIAEKLGAPIVAPADVTDPESMDQLFQHLKEEWG
ncbi:MAG: SDR family oxidoreductase, partial [Geminicoccaceae bacterium]